MNASAAALLLAFCLTALVPLGAGDAPEAAPRLDVASAEGLLDPVDLAGALRAAEEGAYWDTETDQVVRVAAAAALVPTELALSPGKTILVYTGTDLIGASKCTSGFVFRAAGTQYLSSAGHCGTVNENVLMWVSPTLVAAFGQVHFVSNWGNCSPTPCIDYMIIRIHANYQALVNPQPTLAAAANGYCAGFPGSFSSPPAKLYVNGASNGGALTPDLPAAHTGTYQTSTSTNTYTATMSPPTNGGDSGAAVLYCPNHAPGTPAPPAAPYGLHKGSNGATLMWGTRIAGVTGYTVVTW